MFRIAPQLVWRPAYALIAIVIVVTVFAVGGAVERSNTSRFKSELRTSLSEKISTVRAQLEGNINGEAQLIRGLVASIAIEPDISNKRLYALASEIFQETTLPHNISAAPDLVIDFVYPLEGNEAAIGLDYKTNEAQREAAEYARFSRGIVFAGPVNLVQGGRGFISRAPVFFRDEITGKQVFWGLVSSVIDVDALYRASGLQGDDLPVEIAIRGKDALGAQGELFFGREQVFGSDPIYAEVSLPQGSWQMAAIPKGGWPVQADNFQRVRLLIIITGVAILSLTMVVTRLLHQRSLAETRLESAIDATEEGFVLYDPDDRLVICNEKYKEFYEKSADLLVPGNTFDYIIREGIKRGQYSESVGCEEEWIEQRMAAHRAANYSIEQLLDDGRWLKITEHKTPDGGTVGFRVDITDLKKAKEKAEHANKAKSEFISSMNHELRTPLTAIRGSLDLACSGVFGELPPKVFDILSIGQRNTKRLLLLVNDILDISRLEAGEFPYNIETLSSEEMLLSAVEVNEPYANERQIELNYLSTGEPFNVLADSNKIQQVLSNLISNAVKFSPEGATVELAARKEGEFCEFSVRDYGSGIPKEFESNLFGRFTQADSSDTRAAGGVGLGLSISRPIVEDLGGTISYETESGVGTTFRFTLPLAT